MFSMTDTLSISFSNRYSKVELIIPISKPLTTSPFFGFFFFSLFFITTFSIRLPCSSSSLCMFGLHLQFSIPCASMCILFFYPS
ncbi:hypothetical protein BDV33DRAFT_166628 [Aspergillus novoparasiticus]|uniref:Uncharacterized protein n=1 Tax=Aspergillus novoparasiticus TaxID=986946 RepID=A0A5N6F3R3_9EURO|nr:hypothetical protein BDV33DRAFT_166628 [Aspergillus novoparasiticus]